MEITQDIIRLVMMIAALLTAPNFTAKSGRDSCIFYYLIMTLLVSAFVLLFAK